MRLAETKPDVELIGTIERETEKAVLFEVKEIKGQGVLNESQTEWFPKSQISRTVTSHNIGEDRLWVAHWLVAKKELV